MTSRLALALVPEMTCDPTDTNGTYAPWDADIEPDSSPQYLLTEETAWAREMLSLPTRLKELVTMHTYARPAWSQTEEAFIADYISNLKGAYADAFGNWIVSVGLVPSKVCFTSHTDTVAWYEGQQGLELAEGVLQLALDSEATCLGADCTAGVWVMRRLILAGKPGLYIFHRDEESGGQGSTWIAENTPELLQGIDFVISLDRKGYTSIITEQYMGETASAAFANSIAPMLPSGMKADPFGSFTDSAFYSHLVSECSNLSVGYHDCHTRKETLDIKFLDALFIKLAAMDHSKLVSARLPQPHSSHFGRSSHMGAGWTDYMAGENDPNPISPRQSAIGPTDHETRFLDRELLELIRRHPEAVALLLQQWDLSTDDVYAALVEL